MKYLRINRLLLLLLTIALGGCAKIVAPVGGPKDVTPPTVVKEVPANGSNHFSGNTIKISFDEFVTLDNTFENVLISPPFATQPTYTLSGKTLTIKIADTLQPNQTYNFGFANCIKDFTEGNPIIFYNYAFSTGEAVDSFMLKGRVVDAQTEQSVKDCFVFAYEQNIDSLPFTTRPKYITKTQNDGRFFIKNIKEGQYKIFALKDINNNLIFDLPNEEIAFTDELLSSVKMPVEKKDTLSDSTSVTKDSIQIPKQDTINQEVEKEMTLYLFTEEDTTQSFVKIQNKEVGKYEFIYKSKIKSHRAEILYPTPDSVGYFEIVGKDTLTWFMKQPVTDSVVLVMIVNDTVRDTLRLEPYKKLGAKTTNRRGKTEGKNTLSVSYQNAGELFSPITLTFPYPIRPTESAIPVTIIATKKYSGNDTSFVSLTIPDTLVRSIVILKKFEPKTPYQLLIRDSVFMGYNGHTNDTVRINFTTKSEKDYGLLRMRYHLQDKKYPFIIQLLNANNQVVRTDVIAGSTTLTYTNLIPGNYKIKVIEDRNGNGEWDTGNYRQKRAPEKIYFFKKPISIRGYWELEEEWTIGE